MRRYYAVGGKEIKLHRRAHHGKGEIELLALECLTDADILDVQINFLPFSRKADHENHLESGYLPIDVFDC